MNSINITARAKINLSLEVKGKRSDGYHLLSMVMQTVDISDRIKISENRTGRINIAGNTDRIPFDARNIGFRAAVRFLREIRSGRGYDIFIEKNIPSGAGMGGGSADAAAVLSGLNYMNQEPLSMNRLMELGLELGADVPFCLAGGTRLAEGIGEKFTQLRDLDLNLLIVKPDWGISTSQVFRRLNLDSISGNPDNEKLVKAINENDRQGIYANMGNALYETSLAFVPEMKNIISKLYSDFRCPKAMMTGSGSTVFGIFEDAEDLKKAHAYFSEIYRDVYITRTIRESILIDEAK